MADRCWRCGAELTGDVAFCGQCGAKVRADAPDLEFFTDVAPEKPAPIEAASTDGSRWLSVVGVALVAGLVAFFALTSTDDDTPSADPYDERADFDAVDSADASDTTVDGTTAAPPTTTVPVTFGDVAAPLSWAVAGEGIDGYPLAIVESGRSVFVFVTDSIPAWFDVPGGVQFLQFTSGGDWIDHGTVIPEDSQVLAVVEGDDGLLASGLNGDGDPTVWRSSDGITWSAEVLPGTAVDNRPARPTHIVERDGVVVVASSTINPWRQISTAMAERFGQDVVAPNPPDWQPGSDEVSMRGPFGLTIATVTFDELDLDREELDEWYQGPQPTPIWVFDDGAWASNVVRGDATTLTAAADGRIHLVTSADTDEVSVYRGGAWQRIDTETDLFRIQAWDDGFVGEGSAGRLGILDADFELVRETLPPGAGFGENATLDHLSTGPLGLVASVIRWDGFEPFDFDDAPDVDVVVLRDDYRLEAGPAHLLRLSRNGEEVLRIDAWSGDAGYRADLDADEPGVGFLDPDSGEVLVTFTLEELRHLERETDTDGPSIPQTTSLLFTTDGERWLGGDVKLLDPDAPTLVLSHVGTERLYSLVVTLRDDDIRSISPALQFDLLHVEPRG